MFKLFPSDQENFLLDSLKFEATQLNKPSIENLPAFRGKTYKDGLRRVMLAIKEMIPSQGDRICDQLNWLMYLASSTTDCKEKRRKNLISSNALIKSEKDPLLKLHENELNLWTSIIVGGLKNLLIQYKCLDIPSGRSWNDGWDQLEGRSVFAKFVDFFKRGIYWSEVTKFRSILSEI